MSTRHVPLTVLRVPRRLVSGAAFALLAAALAWALLEPGGGGWHALAFGLMPDVALLVGIAPGLAKGQLHPRAVPLYNALHYVAGPVALGILAAAWLGTPWLAAALSWAAHIALDRTVGYGPRTREGFQRG